MLCTGTCSITFEKFKAIHIYLYQINCNSTLTLTTFVEGIPWFWGACGATWNWTWPGCSCFGWVPPGTVCKLPGLVTVNWILGLTVMTPLEPMVWICVGLMIGILALGPWLANRTCPAFNVTPKMVHIKVKTHVYKTRQH